MSWLARLKDLESVEADATKPTKPGFVGFVAPLSPLVRNLKGQSAATEQPAANEAQPPNDPLPELTDHSARARENPAALEPAGYLTGEQRHAVHFPAWTEAECETFAGWLVLFMARGIEAEQADHLAELLLLRNREQDNRRLCLECSHYRRAAASCPAGRTIQAVDRLHRCGGFQKILLCIQK
jgi:hypothetical protein